MQTKAITNTIKTVHTRHKGKGNAYVGHIIVFVTQTIKQMWRFVLLQVHPNVGLPSRHVSVVFYCNSFIAFVL